MKMKKNLRIPRYYLRPDWRQLLLPLFTATFVLLMVLMVLSQNQTLETPFADSRFYLIFSVFIAGFVVVASLYSIFVDANFTTLLSAVGILFAVGGAYRFLFNGIKEYCLVSMAVLLMAVVVYVVARHANEIPDKWFMAIVGMIGLLLLINIIFGVEDKGAKLTVRLIPGGPSLQPGEYIKVLTMILGACSYQNERRSKIYCATTLGTCLVMAGLINDLGNTMVIFAMFVLMTYLLFDNRKLSIGIIVGAAVALALVLLVRPHVLGRINNWTKVMELRGNAPEQFKMIRSVLFGGWDGRGLADCATTLKINAAQHDVAMAGVTAVYGISISCLAMMAYALLVAQPAYNRSVHPSGFLMMCQFSMYVFVQAALNMGGSLDLLPFTGIVSPLISDGLNQMVCFGALLGLVAASIHPKISR